MSDQSELARREQRAQQGIVQFAEEMQVIRDGNLYPGAKREPDAWKSYCQERWGMARRTVDQTIHALPVLQRFTGAPGAHEMPSVSAAASVATLPEKVQDAILTDAPKRNTATDKAKAARKAQRKAEAEGRQASDEELIKAAAAIQAPAKKTKARKHSKFTRFLEDAYYALQQAADVAQGDTLTDVENDYGWNRVAKVEYEVGRIRERLYQPADVKDVDAALAELLGA